MYLYFSAKLWGVDSEDWYRVSAQTQEEPDYDLPEEGSLTVGGREVERPISIGGGAFDVPSGEEDRRTTVDLSDVRKTVLTFDQTTIEYGYAVLGSSQGYSGGDMAARFYFFMGGAGSGNISMEVRIKTYKDGDSLAAFSGSLYAAPTRAVTAQGTLYVTQWTDYFSPENTPERGDQWQIQIRRNTGIGGNVSADMWLSDMQIVYPKDRATDRP